MVTEMTLNIGTLAEVVSMVTLNIGTLVVGIRKLVTWGTKTVLTTGILLNLVNIVTLKQLITSVTKVTFTIGTLLNLVTNFDVWLTVHRSSMWIKRPTRCHF